MPITKADVLAVLNDPRLKNMHFSIGEITVSADEYRNVADYIKEDDIRVIPGRDPVAYYNGHLNTLETQAGNPPLNLADRAQVLHECTHALVDINGLDVFILNDEVAAYLAQLTYMMISSPTPFQSPFPPAGAGPQARLTISLLRVVRTYNLHTSQGFGARISELDIVNLRRAVRALPPYARIAWAEKGNAQDAGVPIKNNQMRSMREAIKRGQRGRARPAAYSPSPRIEIF